MEFSQHVDVRTERLAQIRAVLCDSYRITEGAISPALLEKLKRIEVAERAYASADPK